MKGSRSFYLNQLLALLVFTILLSLGACSKEKDDPDTMDCTGISPTYSANIKPILDGSCAISGCHDAITHEENLNLSTFAGAVSASGNNNFLGSIQHKNGYEPMPKDASKLSADKIQLLTCWVQNGSPQ